MNDGTEYWRKIQEMFERILSDIRRWFQRKLFQVGKFLGVKTYQKSSQFVRDHSSNLTLKSVKKDGKTKDLISLGEFDRKEMERIYREAQSRNIRIAVSPRNGHSKRITGVLADADAQSLLRIENEEIKLKTELNLISMKEEGGFFDRREKKMKDINEKLENLKLEKANLYKATSADTYILLVNADHKDFVERIKNDYLDHDIKQNIAELSKQIQDKTELNQAIHDMKNLRESVPVKEEELNQLNKTLSEKEKIKNDLEDKLKDDSLTEEEKNTYKEQKEAISKELKDITEKRDEKKDECERLNEALQKQTFSGTLTLDSIKNDIGNVSPYHDYYDVVRYKEGFISFTMTPEEYYKFTQNEESKLSELHYAAFKAKANDDVTIVCSATQTNAMCNLAKKYKTDTLDVRLNQSIDKSSKNVQTSINEEVNLNNLNYFSFDIEDNEKLDETLKMIETVHAKGNEQYHAKLQPKENGYSLNLSSTMQYTNFAEKGEKYTKALQQKAKEAQDEHIRAVKNKDKESFIKNQEKNLFSKAQEDEIHIASQYFYNRNDQNDNDKIMQFLSNPDLKAKEMKEYRQAFLNGLSVDEALEKQENGVPIEDIIGDFIDIDGSHDEK